MAALETRQAVTLPRAPVRTRSLVLAPAAAAIVLLGHQLFYLNAIGFDAIDDAYISFRYAANLAAGRGLVFNPGERVEGYTNLLWTVLMAACIRLGLPPAPVALAFGALCALGTLLLVARAALPRQPAVGGFAALLLAVDGSYALWSVSGMETSLFMLLLAAGALRYWQELAQPRRFAWSGLLFGLATLTRPEGAMVSTLTVFHACVTRWRQERRIAAWSDIQRVLLFLLLAGGQELFRILYYGKLVPNTYTAKVDLGAVAQVVRGLGALATFVYLRGNWPVLLTLPLGWLALRRSGNAVAAGYCALVVIPYLLYIVVVGGDWSIGRFFVPILPFAYLLAAAGLLQLWQWLTTWGVRRFAALRCRQQALGGVALALLLLGLFLGSSLWGEDALYVEYFHVKQAGRARTAMGHWLHDHTPPDALIAVDAAGQIPYYADRRFIDLYGLNTTAVANLPVATFGESTAGHDKFGLDYVIRVDRPDYIVIYGHLLDAAVYQSHYRTLTVPWTTDRVLKRLLGIYQRR